jgi:hypothetical protein
VSNLPVRCRWDCPDPCTVHESTISMAKLSQSSVLELTGEEPGRPMPELWRHLQRWHAGTAPSLARRSKR